MKKTILTSCVLAILCGVALPSYGADLKVGDDAPEFTLPGSDGKLHKLSEYKGKQAVVIAWFPKAFTGGWTAECNSLRASGDQIRKFNVAYFTASCDGKDTNKKFADSLKLDYAILSDPSKKTAKAYGVVHAKRAVPERWTFYIGKNGKILHIDKKVKAGNHGNDIVKQLAKLDIEKK